MKKEFRHNGALAPRGPGSSSKAAKRTPLGREGEGTSRAIPNYPLHCAVQTLPTCPSEEKSPQNEKESESSGTPPPGVTAVSKGRDVAAAKEGALPSLCSAPSVVDGSLR